jgi:hypothetical protein
MAAPIVPRQRAFSSARQGRHARADARRLAVGEDNEGMVTLDDLAREGARRMIAAALEAEVI